MGLYELFLAILERKLKVEASEAVRWIDQLAEGDPTDFLQRHPSVWPRVLGAFDANERRLLSGLLDVQLGLDAVRYYSGRALVATDLRELYMVTTMMPILVERLLQRVEHLVKRARRTGLVDETTESEVMAETGRYRAADPLLAERDPSAHGAYVSDEAWIRTPEKLRYWELVALTDAAGDPMAWTYRGEIDPEMHVDTRRRLAAVETTMGRALSALLSGVQRDDA